MNERRFAPLTKVMVSATGTRRRAWQSAVALALAGILPTLSSPQPVQARRKKRLTFACQGATTGHDALSAGRYAQTFTAQRSGILREVRVRIQKGGTTPGNYVVQLVPVVAGVPASSPLWVFAAGMVADEAVPNGETTLVVRFTGTRLGQGGTYAVVVMRLGTAELTLVTTDQASCADSQMFLAFGSGEFSPVEKAMLVSVFVD
jgi:hypothetical protein